MSPSGEFDTGEELLRKVPPHSVDAERAVLGALLLDARAMDDVAGVLTTEQFYRASHAEIYKTIAELWKNDQPVDVVLVNEELNKKGLLDQIGGTPYLVELTEAVPTSANASFYAELVRDYATRRKLIEVAAEVQKDAYEDTGPTPELLDRSEKRLFDVTQKRIRSEAVPVEVVVKEAFERLETLRKGEGVNGVPSGLADLDELTQGFQPGEMTILAARPSMGKCLAHDAQVVLSDGSLASMEQVHRARRAQLLTLDRDWQLRATRPSDYVDDGVKPVFRVTTALGRRVDTTLSHPFLRPSGWTRLEHMQVGDRVAVPRRIPVFGRQKLPTGQVELLAFLTSASGLNAEGLHFATSRAPLGRAFGRALASCGLRAVAVKRPVHAPAWRAAKQTASGRVAAVTAAAAPSAAASTATTAAATTAASSAATTADAWTDPLAGWIAEHGLGGPVDQRELPAQVFRLTRERLALFLNRLFSCDGWLRYHPDDAPRVGFVSASETLARQVQHLLLRFGVLASLARCEVGLGTDRRVAWQLDVTHADALARFCDAVGLLDPNLTAARAQLPAGSAEDLSGEPCDVYWDRVVSIEPLGPKQVYDLTIPVTHNFVADDVLVHNTSLALTILRNITVYHGKAGVFFSLEMPRLQVTSNILCGLAKIDGHKLRGGYLTRDEERQFLDAAEVLGPAQLFIDDTPGLSTMDLRAKGRRLKAQHDIDMIMIDYMQLMSGSANSARESRQQEVSEISRQTKALARELEIPIIALAQLSRKVEERKDHEPMMSDLRESGCLTGDTLITLADTGRRVPIRDLVDQSGFHVWAMHPETFALERAPVSNAFSTGVKPVFRMTTRLGRTIRATANHRFFSFDGWKRLDQLKVGERLALPRKVSRAEQQPSMSGDELALLGHLIGDGCTLPRRTIQYTTREADLAETVLDLARSVFGEEVRPHQKDEGRWIQVFLPSTRPVTHGVRNPVAAWLDDLGCWGKRAYEKRVPSRVFEQPPGHVGRFLAHLWATDGCVRMRGGKNPYPAIYYATSSQGLGRDVQALLLTLGINARLKRMPQGEKGRDQYHVILGGKTDMLRFADQIGAVGEYKQAALSEIREFLEPRVENTNRDVVPAAAWQRFVEPARVAQGLTQRSFQARLGTAYCGTSLYKSNLSRSRAAAVAEIVESSELKKLATSDLYWDPIVSIEPDGEEEVFDLTVPEYHSFVADEIVVHNSIEQDADLIMLLYRPAYYEPENEALKGVAYVNVAKNRNGPTGKVQLHFQKNQMRFESVARM